MRFCPQCAQPLRRLELSGKTRDVCMDNRCGFVNWNNPVPVVAGIVEWNDHVMWAGPQHGTGSARAFWKRERCRKRRWCGK